MIGKSFLVQMVLVTQSVLEKRGGEGGAGWYAGCVLGCARRSRSQRVCACVRRSCSTAPGVYRRSWIEDASELPEPVRSTTPYGLGLELRTAGDKAATSSPLREGGAGGPVASALAAVYLCATLALGAYICYRASLR